MKGATLMKGRIFFPILAFLGMVAPIAFADWVAKDGTGSDVTFEGYVNGGIEHLPKHVLTNSSGVNVGTEDSNPVSITLSPSSPSIVNATQGGIWTMATSQSGPWSVAQLNPPWVVSSGGIPWIVSQSGAWNVGQTGPWTVGINAGSNLIGNVNQSGAPWAFNLSRVSGAVPSLTNAFPTRLAFGSPTSTFVGTSNPIPSNCTSGCTAAEGGAVTYAVGAVWITQASPSDIALFQGSSTRVVKIQKVNIAFSGGAMNTIVTMTRRSSGNTGGTSQTPVIGKLDKNDPAPTALFRTYTANPTAVGTDQGDLRAFIFGSNVSGASTNISPSQTYTFGGNGLKPITLRGTSEYLAFTMTATLVSTARLTVEWTEE